MIVLVVLQVVWSDISHVMYLVCNIANHVNDMTSSYVM